MLSIDIDTARRFILGKQGLWPGRRWQGLDGTAAAMRAMDYLQLDPLQMVARSQDIALHSRVLDYTPGQWEAVTYDQRQFFDWGGWLAVRPMDELPHWRVVMQRERDGHPDSGHGVRESGEKHAEAIAEMRALLLEHGQLSNRDFAASARRRTHSYRGRKDSALALYYLWRIGEVMIHHRENFERVYALTEAVAPAPFIRQSSDAEADRFLFQKEISFNGLAALTRRSDLFLRGVPHSRRQEVLDSLLADDSIVPVRVDGWKPVHYLLRRDADLLATVAAGRVPAAWTPIGPDTREEAVFLAPLDHVSARGRAKVVFGFDYVWEVYKPADKRVYGYYVLPVLWGDRLVARFDSKLDRTTNTLIILGLWLEDAALGTDAAFAEALARGFARWRRVLGADHLDAQAVHAPLLRGRITALGG